MARLSRVKRQPVAWVFDIARAVLPNGEYTQWERRLGFTKPNVPDSSLRNMRPLFADDETTAGHERCARLEELVRVLLDNDPNELAADGGITVLDVWRKEAATIMESK